MKPLNAYVLGIMTCLAINAVYRIGQQSILDQLKLSKECSKNSKN